LLSHKPEIDSNLRLISPVQYVLESLERSGRNLTVGSKKILFGSSHRNLISPVGKLARMRQSRDPKAGHTGRCSNQKWPVSGNYPAWSGRPHTSTVPPIKDAVTPPFDCQERAHKHPKTAKKAIKRQQCDTHFAVTPSQVCNSMHVPRF
jgi:hypothetical protein